MSSITLSSLTEAVAGGSVAVRANVVLQPAGGPGTKVFPSTYQAASVNRAEYAIEERHAPDGTMTKAALLSSVASTANWIELRLRDRLNDEKIAFPNPYVDFSGEEHVADIGWITALEAPHRLADAIFRDSLLDGDLFRRTDIGKKITNSSPNNATALYMYNPVALVLGMWDSTGPKGGLGNKFQRSLVSEIVGEGAVIGVSVKSRIDPLQIRRGAADIYEHPDPIEKWTLDSSEAVKEDDGSPRLMPATNDHDPAGRPSQVNHGNYPPRIEAWLGGVTITRAVQTSVLSLAGLRKLSFPVDVSGRVLSGSDRRQAEVAAHTVLAALGLAGLTYLYYGDYDLRSRCLLVPESPLTFEFLQRGGGEPVTASLDVDEADALVADAAAAATDAGMGWPTESLRLTPAPKLADLIRRNRALSAGDTSES